MHTPIKVAGLTVALLLPLAACSTTAATAPSSSMPMTSASSG